MNQVKVCTIGFTKTNAEGFFERLRKAGVKTVIDVRLHNTSQLAAFAKADDLAYFLRKIGDIKYLHQPLFAPTDSMLKTFKKEKGDWSTYENRFLALMAERQIEKRITRFARSSMPPLLGSDTPPLPSSPCVRVPKRTMERRATNTSHLSIGLIRIATHFD